MKTLCTNGSYASAGVLFQFARVGNDAEAEKFLKYLDEESYVKDYVDTLSGNDLMDLVGARAGSRAPKDLQDVYAPREG